MTRQDVVSRLEGLGIPGNASYDLSADRLADELAGNRDHEAVSVLCGLVADAQSQIPVVTASAAVIGSDNAEWDEFLCRCPDANAMCAKALAEGIAHHYYRDPVARDQLNAAMTRSMLRYSRRRAHLHQEGEVRRHIHQVREGLGQDSCTDDVLEYFQNMIRD
ncbi:MAG: hypothetical protein BWY68_00508 [bacterium ADurb.Bin400]|nr:MAG: hypothetical protein BWY68_00508 [bacterium ADurb.Bin400]